MRIQIAQAAASSFQSIWENKLRSLTTMLGIVIGVSAVLIVISIGEGAQKFILSRVESLGSNLVSISPGSTEGDDLLSSLTSFTVTSLKYDDIEYLRNEKEAPNVVEVAGYNKGFSIVYWRSESYDASLTGTTASYLVVEESELEEGRFFTEEEEKNLSRVAVLGSLAKEELFGDSDAIGQRIKISNQTFEIIGTMKERGVVPFEDFDSQIILPIKSMHRLVNINHVGLIRAKINAEENINSSIQDIEAILREKHDIRDMTGGSDDFTVSSSVQRLDIVTAITDSVRFFLAAMAALSLVVSGIGIMNIMFISVVKRTREIGLRKSIGANNGHIMSQFLLEAVLITGIGGAIGVVIGTIVSVLIAVGVYAAGFGWLLVISPLSIALAFGVSAAIGLFFGYYPARKASKLDPIVALHYE